MYCGVYFIEMHIARSPRGLASCPLTGLSVDAPSTTPPWQSALHLEIPLAPHTPTGSAVNAASGIQTLDYNIFMLSALGILRILVEAEPFTKFSTEECNSSSWFRM